MRKTPVQSGKMVREDLTRVRRRQFRAALMETLLFLLLFMFVMLPIMWSVITSLKEKREVLAYPPKVVGFEPVMDNYRTILSGGYLRALLNSILYSGAAIAIGLLFGMLAAYGLHRCRFRGRKLLFYIIVAGIPLATGSAALLIPNYIYFTNIGLTDKFYTLPIIFAGYNLPMSIWIMRGGLESIPIEIEEAAAIDGCSRLYIIFRLVPRLNRPAMASAAIFIFIGAWNEFIVSSVMINSSSLRPLQMAIYDYMGYFGIEWGPLTAAASFGVIPVLIVFTFLGKYMISGMTQGSVKG